jgi:hypothetical protein
MILVYFFCIFIGLVLFFMPVVDWFFHRKIEEEKTFEIEYTNARFIWETAASKEAVIKLLKERTWPGPFEDIINIREIKPGYWPARYK